MIRKILFAFVAIAALASFAKPKAPQGPVNFDFIDKFTDDALHQTYDSASIQMWLDTDKNELKLCILPDVSAVVSQALVDTAWTRNSYYQNGENVDNDLFRERKVTYLYTLSPTQTLKCYYVISHFIDKEHKGLQQIVIRKFNAQGKRQWCANINAGDVQIKDFFNMLAYACKSLKFEKLTSVMSDPDASGLQQRGQHENNVLNTHHSVGSGSPLKIGW